VSLVRVAWAISLAGCLGCANEEPAPETATAKSVAASEPARDVVAASVVVAGSPESHEDLDEEAPRRAPVLPRGFLPPKLIRETIEERISAVRRCWKSYLASDGVSEPRVVARFVINPRGRVDSVDVVHSSFNRPEVDQCVAKIVKALRFPWPRNPTGYVTVTYPFMRDNAR